MNTQYFQYVIEVEKTGSITQAANNLYMGQPTLSKAIKEMESTLGFAIFRRTSKGVVPTQKGLEFLGHAKKIAAQIQKMEQSMQAQEAEHQLFSLAIPRVSYIAQATADFVATFDNEMNMEVDILETNATKIMDAVAYCHFVLGIIRYHVEDEEHFLKRLAERNLHHETIWQSSYVALMHEKHPLAALRRTQMSDFDPYIEVAFGDDEVPYVKTSESAMGAKNKRILIYDRALQCDMLRANPLAYAWVSPLPAKILQGHGLVQRPCAQSGGFKDVLISRAGYRYSRLDRQFIDQLYLQKNKAAFDL